MRTCSDSPLADPAVTGLLARSRISYLAVESRHGPHATPHEFAFDGERVWFVASSKALKVRALRRRPQAGLLVRDGQQAAVLTGRASILSLEQVGEATRLLVAAPWVAMALGAYARRNFPVMLGYALDLGQFQPGASPVDRVLVAVTIERGLLLDGGTVEGAWGDWPIAAARPTRSILPSAIDLPEDVPEDLAGLTTHDGDVVVGWSGPEGDHQAPLALPATWDSRRGRAYVGRSVLDAVGAPPASPACVAFDRSEGIRPSRFRGLLLRGPGELATGRQSSAAVVVRPERVTWWDGFASATTPAAALADRVA